MTGILVLKYHIWNVHSQAHVDVNMESNFAIQWCKNFNISYFTCINNKSNSLKGCFSNLVVL